jgi:uncharacterized repeat protein (TIGR03803 family)
VGSKPSASIDTLCQQINVKALGFAESLSQFSSVVEQRFWVLYNFTGLGDGNQPSANLVLSDNVLYGTAAYGGSSGNGTVFRVNTDGTGFKTLHDFGPLNTFANSDGANPFGSLILSGNTLYGTTLAGGMTADGSSGNGTIFEIGIDGTGFSTLYSFTGGSDGATPRAGVALSGNTLYGTTLGGGTSGNGVVFSFSLGLAIQPPHLAIVSSGADIVLAWPTDAGGFTLQSTASVSSGVWNTHLPAPVIINGQYTVTFPISGTRQFFRLSQ